MSDIAVITIDGPVGVGKGTLALRLARFLGWHTLDSGAIYRVLALAAQKHKVALDDELGLCQLAESLQVNFQAMPDLSSTQVWLENQDVSRELRTEICGAAASQLAALTAVRQALLARQRAFQQPPGLVADGRDMGTVVFPDAPLKLFLTASVAARAERRYKQLKQQEFDVNMDSLMNEIALRDQRDMSRAVAPLIPAIDANIVDTTALTVDEVLAQVLHLVAQKLSML
jgi:cytidylate kinase